MPASQHCSRGRDHSIEQTRQAAFSHAGAVVAAAAAAAVAVAVAAAGDAAAVSGENPTDAARAEAGRCVRKRETAAAAAAADSDGSEEGCDDRTARSGAADTACEDTWCLHGSRFELLLFGQMSWSHDLVVMMSDSESERPSSILGGTSLRWLRFHYPISHYPLSLIHLL